MDTVKNASLEKKNSLEHIVIMYFNYQSKSKQMFKRSSKKAQKAEGQKEKTQLLVKSHIGLKSSKSFSEKSDFSPHRAKSFKKSNNGNVSDNQDLEAVEKTKTIGKIIKKINDTGLQEIDYVEEIHDVQYVESEEITDEIEISRNRSYEEGIIEIQPISDIEEIQVVSDLEAIEILTYEVQNFSETDEAQENKPKAVRTSQKQKPIKHHPINSKLKSDNNSSQYKDKQAIFIQSCYRGYLIRRMINKSMNRKYINILEFCLVIRRLFCKKIFKFLSIKFPITKKTLFMSLNKIFRKRIQSVWKFFILRSEILKENLQRKSNLNEGLIISNYIYHKFAVRRYFNVWLQRVEAYRSKKIVMKSYFNVVVGMNYLEEALKFTQLKTTLMSRLKILKSISKKYEKFRKLLRIRQLCIARNKLKFLNKWREKNNLIGMKLKKVLASVYQIYKKIPKRKMLAIFKKWSFRITQLKSIELRWKVKSENIYKLFLVIRKYYIKKLTIFKRLRHFIKYRITEIKNLDKLLEMLVLVIRKYCFKKHLFFKRLLRQSIINKIIVAEFPNKEGHMEKLGKAVKDFAIKKSLFFSKLQNFEKNLIIIVPEIINKTDVIEMLIIAIRRCVFRRHSIFAKLKAVKKPQGRRVVGIGRSNTAQKRGRSAPPEKGIISKGKDNGRKISNPLQVFNPQRKRSEADNAERLINAIRTYVNRRLSIFLRLRKIISSTVNKAGPSLKIEIYENLLTAVRKYLIKKLSICARFGKIQKARVIEGKITTKLENLKKLIIAIRKYFMIKHSIFKRFQEIFIKKDIIDTKREYRIKIIDGLIIAIKRHLQSIFTILRENIKDKGIVNKLAYNKITKLEFLEKFIIAIRNYIMKGHLIFKRLQKMHISKNIKNNKAYEVMANKKHDIGRLLIAMRRYIFKNHMIFKYLCENTKRKVSISKVKKKISETKLENFEKFTTLIRNYTIRRHSIFSRLKYYYKNRQIVNKLIERKNTNIGPIIEKLIIAIRKYCLKRQQIFSRFLEITTSKRRDNSVIHINQNVLKLENLELIERLIIAIRKYFARRHLFFPRFLRFLKYNGIVNKVVYKEIKNKIETLDVFMTAVRRYLMKRHSIFSNLLNYIKYQGIAKKVDEDIPIDAERIIILFRKYCMKRNSIFARFRDIIKKRVEIVDRVVNKKNTLKQAFIEKLIFAIRKYILRKYSLITQLKTKLTNRVIYEKISNMVEIITRFTIAIRNYTIRRHSIFSRMKAYYKNRQIVNKLIERKNSNLGPKIEKLFIAIRNYCLRRQHIFSRFLEITASKPRDISIIHKENHYKIEIMNRFLISIRTYLIRKYSIFTTFRNKISKRGIINKVVNEENKNKIELLMAAVRKYLMKRHLIFAKILKYVKYHGTVKNLDEEVSIDIERVRNLLRKFSMKRNSIFDRFRDIINKGGIANKKVNIEIAIKKESIDSLIKTIRTYILQHSIFENLREKIKRGVITNRIVSEKITTKKKIAEELIIAIRTFIIRRHSIFEMFREITKKRKSSGTKVNKKIEPKQEIIKKFIIAIRTYILIKTLIFVRFREIIKKRGIVNKIDSEKIQFKQAMIERLMIAIRKYLLRNNSIFEMLGDNIKNGDIVNLLVYKDTKKYQGDIENLINVIRAFILRKHSIFKILCHIIKKGGIVNKAVFEKATSNQANIDMFIISIRTYILRRCSLFAIFHSFITNKPKVKKVVYEENPNETPIMNRFIIGIRRYLIKKNSIFTTFRDKILKRGIINKGKYQKISMKKENLAKFTIAIRKYLMKKHSIFERFKNRFIIFKKFKGAQILHKNILKIQNSKLFYAIQKLKNHNQILLPKLKRLFEKKIQTLNFLKKYKVLPKYFNQWIKKAFWMKMQHNFQQFNMFCLILQNMAIKRTAFFDKLRIFVRITNLKQIIEKRFNPLNITFSKIKAKHFNKWKNQGIENKLYVLKNRILQMILKKLLKSVKRRDLRIYLKIWKEKYKLTISKNVIGSKNGHTVEEYKVKLISKTIKSILKSKQDSLIKCHFSLWRKMRRPKFSDSLSIYRNFNTGFSFFKKIITGPLNSFFINMRNVSIKNSNHQIKEIHKNTSAKINLKSVFIKFFILELNIYAIEYNHLTRLCILIKTINKFKEMNRRSNLITIFTKWWLVVSMKKFQKKKIANLYKKMNLLFLEAVDDLFGEKSDTVQEYVEKVYNLNVKQEVYAERFQIESKQIVEVGYEEKIVLEDMTLINTPNNDREIESISENESLFLDKSEISQYEEDDEDSHIDVDGNQELKQKAIKKM